MKALIIDDDEVNLVLTEAILKKLNFQISKSSSSELALEIFRSENFDLIITDFHMPHLNGAKIVTLIRETELSQNRSPAIIIGTSSEIGAEIKREFSRAGANDFLPKPTRLKTLNKMVTEYFTKRAS